MVFYDFEVTRYDWLVVAIDPTKNEPYKIHNDTTALKELYTKYKKDIWIGYNNRHYDQWILKGILCGFNPYQINDHLINQGKSGYTYSKALNDIYMINYDVGQQYRSLKELEGFQGHSIYESSIDFNIDRPLTPSEVKEMFSYCLNDVVETINIFEHNINDFNALLWLVKEYKFPISYLNKTKAQIVSEILECTKVTRDDEWDITPASCIKLDKYKAAAEWFTDNINHDYKKSFSMVIAGVEHELAWGGIHGALEKYHYKCDDEYILVHVDVESYYPRWMIFHNLLTRNAKKPERFKAIFDRRMELKHAGKKKEQAPYKIVINGAYGIEKDPNNSSYDPRNANLICINGQLALVDLIEKLEVIPSFKLIQSNTDGLIIKIKRSEFEMLDDICYEWESRCNMVLGFDYIKEIWQKDVNNYMFVDFEGKLERKGAYVKELNGLDNDLPIINKALIDNMLKGVPVEDTINNCDDLIMFQKICKLSNKFDCVEYHRNRFYGSYGQVGRYTNKCYRVFASTDLKDGTFYKLKGQRLYKFANTSELSFMDNGDITGKKVPDKLDKEWYINLAKTRLEQFGISDQLRLAV